jgi:hypothetical protein
VLSEEDSYSGYTYDLVPFGRLVIMRVRDLDACTWQNSQDLKLQSFFLLLRL